MSIDKTLTKIGYDDYDVVQIADGIFKINEFNLSTMFVIVGKERAVSIDCGVGVRDYMAAIRKITDLPVDLIATHAHVDHIGGREQFEKMYLSKNDEKIIKDVSVAYRKMYIFIMKVMGFKVLKNKEMSVKKIKKEPEIHFVKEGDVIDLGGKTLEIFETPAHTLGSISLLAREDKILFTGDVINPFNLMFLKHASTLEVMKNTCQKIFDIKGYETLWASHLSDPITVDTAHQAEGAIQKAQKRGNRLLPWISFAKYKDYTIVHLANKRK